MDRFQQQTPADLAANFARSRFAEEIFNSATYSGAVNYCENCGSSCDQLFDVPEFDYRGCERCLDEAIEILKAEAAAPKRKGVGREGGRVDEQKIEARIGELNAQLQELLNDTRPERRPIAEPMNLILGELAGLEWVLRQGVSLAA